jgi:hypothetical protein
MEDSALQPACRDQSVELSSKVVVAAAVVVVAFALQLRRKLCNLLVD